MAEDLTQETFARAFRALPGFRAESSARSWLLAIARRVAADHLRTAARRPRTDPSVDLETVTVHDADQSESVVLRTLVADLEADRRLAFELTQVLGLSYTEAAVVCQCPIGTIRSRVARARDELVQALAEQDGAVAGRRNAHG